MSTPAPSVQPGPDPAHPGQPAVPVGRTAAGLDWDRPASGLTWTVRSTVEHVADDLFAYAGQIATATPELEE